MITQIAPQDFDSWLADAQSAISGSAAPVHSLPVVLDVREPWELQTASLTPDGFTLLAIPMREIPARLTELQDSYGVDHPVACLCHHGMRSQQVANFMAQQGGFQAVVNLQGGIDAWSLQRDSGVPLY